MIQFEEKTYDKKRNLLLIATQDTDFSAFDFSDKEKKFAKTQIENKKKEIVLNRYSSWVFVAIANSEKPEGERLEGIRKLVNTLHKQIAEHKLKKVYAACAKELSQADLYAALESLVLSNYQFLKYKKDKQDAGFSLETVQYSPSAVSKARIAALATVSHAVYQVRDWVNEPVAYMNASRLAKKCKKLGEEAGIEVEIFDKAQIKKYNMVGLLNVNAGSFEPPTFTRMEWKPQNAVNKKPLILVGKGVVYDTGGLSLKPGNYMTTMKSDMAGAATVAASIYTIAKEKLPLHVIALIPATDNRPGNKAYTPDDIVQYPNGVSVEVINTDAEGRMILADALYYAQQYKPELVIDFATLTGSAARALGKFACAMMGNAPQKFFEKLHQAGQQTNERTAQLPFYDDYKEMLKSDIAEIKNVGPAAAGAITAGKFLEYFTDYPYIHIDIAGTAFTEKADSYRGTGATGFGVRLIFDFVHQHIGEKKK